MTDRFSSRSSSELINRKAERQSPDREGEESRYRDVPQADNARAAGGPVANTRSGQPSGGKAADEIARLRGDAEIARLRLEAAHAEIELLRGYRDEAESDAAVARLLVDRLRLTDAEREAVAVAMHRCDGPEFRTLRGLLERMK